MLATNKINGGTMEQNQLMQFTFYDLYAKLIDALNDEERGKLLYAVFAIICSSTENRKN